MPPKMPWGSKILLIGSLLLVLSGCSWRGWQNYVEYQYGQERADRLCHPLWECQQGEWSQVGKSEIETIVDYVDCEQDLEPYGTWFQGTVVFGMETGRCMSHKHYTLQYPHSFGY